MNILITGGKGLLGTLLTEALIKKGHQVSHLSRKPGNDPRIKTYLWNVEKAIIDAKCITNIDTLVHLAGEGIADEHWTAERKKQLVESRTKSIHLVYNLLFSTPNCLKSVISASGIGYYSERGDELLFEESKPLNNFMSECCVKWEEAVDRGLDFDLRVVKFRTGVVLTKLGGALPKIAKPIQLGMGSALGSGKQWVSWIHVVDAVDLYVAAIENVALTGVYNLVAPNPVTNKQLTVALAKQLSRPLWAPAVPAFLLKLLLGEMSAVVLDSTKVSSAKIEKTGYRFKFSDIANALKDIYH